MGRCNFNRTYCFFPWWGCRRDIEGQREKLKESGEGLTAVLLNQATDGEKEEETGKKGKRRKGNEKKGEKRKRRKEK